MGYELPTKPPSNFPAYFTVRQAINDAPTSTCHRKTPLLRYNTRQSICMDTATNFCGDKLEITNNLERVLLYTDSQASDIFRWLHEIPSGLLGEPDWQDVAFYSDPKTVGTAYLTTLGLYALLTSNADQSFQKLHNDFKPEWETFVSYFVESAHRVAQEATRIQKVEPTKTIEQKIA